MTQIDINAVDIDGAVRDTAENAGFDRSEFIKRGVLTGGGLLAGAAFLGPLANAEAAISTTKKSLKNDVAIGNYALTLEYLETDFYRQAIANLGPGGFGGNAALALFAATTFKHEAAHVKGLKAILKSAAVKSPKFAFGNAVTDVATFAATAQVLEDTGVSAYAGQGPNLKTRSIVKAALSIHSVEARHAAWIRFINSGGAGAERGLPAPKSFDVAAGEKTVLKAAGGFIKK